MGIDIKNSFSYIQALLKIRTKDNRITPFILNAPQRRLFEIIRSQELQGKPVRIIILKARQMGFSTLTEGIIFHKTVTKENVSSLVIAHKEEASSNLFAMSKLFYDELPSVVRPMCGSSNARELIFENPSRTDRSLEPGLRSRIKCATAGGKGVGRSDTITNIHASELAFWEGDKKSTLNGLLQAVPYSPDTMVIIESTANGYEYFKELWDRAVSGETDFVPIFFPWFLMPEYRRKYDGFRLTKEELMMKGAFHLDNDQLAWRRWCIRNNCGGDLSLFHQEYPASPEEAFISTGQCIFDKEKIIYRIEAVKDKKTVRRGFFYCHECRGRLMDIRFKKDLTGMITVFEGPKAGYPYVIGGDTAGEGSDFFAAQVINNVTGKQAAVLHGHMDEDEYARQVFCLGKYYNNALVGIESNFSTFPIKELGRLGYKNQFVRQREDSYTGNLVSSFGFRTTAITRPVILGELVRYVREECRLINHADTLRELLHFVRNTRGRPEAEYGAHDDLVMAYAIALYIRQQQTTERQGTVKGVPVARWLPDMWEDYENADEEGRKYLIDKFGDPWGQER